MTLVQNTPQDDPPIAIFLSEYILETNEDAGLLNSLSPEDRKDRLALHLEEGSSDLSSEE